MKRLVSLRSGLGVPRYNTESLVPMQFACFAWSPVNGAQLLNFELFETNRVSLESNQVQQTTRSTEMKWVSQTRNWLLYIQLVGSRPHMHINLNITMYNIWIYLIHIICNISTTNPLNLSEFPYIPLPAGQGGSLTPCQPPLRCDEQERRGVPGAAPLQKVNYYQVIPNKLQNPMRGPRVGHAYNLIEFGNEKCRMKLLVSRGTGLGVPRYSTESLVPMQFACFAWSPVSGAQLVII